MYKRILVAVDGSRGARLALDEALKVAQAADAMVMAVGVIEYSAPLLDVGIGYVDERGATTVASDATMVGIEQANELLALRNIRGSSRVIDARGESVATVLTRAADECRADLIVMGTHGRSGIRRILLGSVAESLLRETRLPVLLIRHGTNTDPVRVFR